MQCSTRLPACPYLTCVTGTRVARVVAPKKEKLKEANAELAVAMKVMIERCYCILISLSLSLSLSLFPVFEC